MDAAGHRPAGAGRPVIGWLDCSAGVSGDMLLGALLDHDGIVLARVSPEDKLRVARALEREGIAPGDRVATMAWNTWRHLETWYGILGIGGVVAFVLGATILVEPGIPGFEIAWQVVAVVAVISVAFTALIAHLAVSSHRRKVETGDHWMIGARAMVQDWDGPQGHVFVHGERWKAVSAAPLEKGQQVRITGIDGLTVTVEPHEAEAT